MADGTVNNANNQFLTLREFTIVFNLRVHNSPRTFTLASVVSFIQLYSSLDNEPTCLIRLIEFACINQLGCGFTAGKRTLLENHISTITV